MAALSHLGAQTDLSVFHEARTGQTFGFPLQLPGSRSLQSRSSQPN